MNTYFKNYVLNIKQRKHRQAHQKMKKKQRTRQSSNLQDFLKKEFYKNGTTNNEKIIQKERIIIKTLPNRKKKQLFSKNQQRPFTSSHNPSPIKKQVDPMENFEKKNFICINDLKNHVISINDLRSIKVVKIKQEKFKPYYPNRF